MGDVDQDLGADPAAEPTVTGLLQRWNAGDAEALQLLVPIVYEELKAIALRYLRNERAETLPCTALVHEAYLRLVDQTQVGWNGRAHFFGAAANVMRRILVDRARRRRSAKRGDGVVPEDISLVTVAIDPALDVIDLHDALTEYERIDPASARTLELRFFAGLSIDEAALVTQTSPATVKRQWSLARAWLYRRLTGEAPAR